MSRSHGDDKWSEWLIRGRSGGGKDGHARAQNALKPTRDRILANANLGESDVVLDIGSGDGFIGLEALRRLGPRGKVIFSDISQPCLDYICEAARGLDVLDRVEFVQASADALDGIPDASVDVLTMRSVLIYVKDKPSAFRNFFRVLRPGGRISISEPIGRDVLWLKRAHKNEFDGYDAGGFAHLLERIYRVESDALDQDPMTDFSHLDLVHCCEEAGFSEVHFDLKIDITRRTPRGWDEYMNAAHNPNALTIQQNFKRVLSEVERAGLEAHLRPLVERGIGKARRVVAYVWAIK